jgi:dihydrofolate reductase
MRTLLAFENISVDGCFADASGDIGWAYRQPPDPEFDAFIAGNASGGGVLLLGRITYELMAGWWPTEQAKQANPVVAEGMNAMQKVVFSRTLRDAAWDNTTVVSDDMAGAVRRMKQEPGPGMAILGSGSIVTQLAREGLIDEYQLVLNPVILGGGRQLCEGLGDRLGLTLGSARAFANGNVVLRYVPGSRPDLPTG